MLNIVPKDNSILNGLEIMKMRNSKRGLDGSFSPNNYIGSKRNNKVGPIVGSVVGVFVALGMLTVIYFFCCLRSHTKLSTITWFPLPLHGGYSENMGRKGIRVATGSHASSRPSSLGRYLTFAEIQEATKIFDEILIPGIGGFGKVF